jgi:hypothetical protein
LVRRLLYGFRDWSDIEPTGRAGSDEGFDVRAWERADAVTNVDEEGEEATKTQGGRLWQIQGKREKSITPQKMKRLIRDGVESKAPPYGYILAAATNISKTTYDSFRETLRAKGVQELYFWGKDYLEDQLALPQNDEILFTFFGISLSPRRRSRVSEIKFGINNKNKIMKLACGSEIPHEGEISHGRSFLLRDVKDTHYPRKAQYADFEKNRRWEEHDAVQITARGVLFKIREWYAYYDAAQKEWDFTRAVDLTPRQHNVDTANEARLEDSGKLVERFWRHLPRRFQAKLMVYGFTSFNDVLIIDDKGDPEYPAPHLFIDFGQHGPFEYTVGNLVWRHQALHEAKFSKFKRRKVFPAKFPAAPEELKIHEWEKLGLGGKSPRFAGTLYSFDGKLDSLHEGDLILLPKTQDRSEEYREITHVYTSTVGTEIEPHAPDYQREVMKGFAGRDVNDDDRVRVYELTRVVRPYSGQGSERVTISWPAPHVVPCLERRPAMLAGQTRRFPYRTGTGNFADALPPGPSHVIVTCRTPLVREADSPV